MRAEQSHRLEGRSLVPFLRGSPPAEWRRFAISEYDYSLLPVAAELGVEPRDARLFMVADKRWKLVQPWASGRCSTTWAPTPTSFATWEPIPPAKISAGV